LKYRQESNNAGVPQPVSVSAFMTRRDCPSEAPASLFFGRCRAVLPGIDVAKTFPDLALREIAHGDRM